MSLSRKKIIVNARCNPRRTVACHATARRRRGDGTQGTAGAHRGALDIHCLIHGTYPQREVQLLFFSDRHRQARNLAFKALRRYNGLVFAGQEVGRVVEAAFVGDGPP